MKAMRVDTFGGPEALKLVEIPTPVPGPGEALIRHEAIGVNFVDTQHRAGTPYDVTAPIIVGTEAAGVVAQVGDGVHDLRVGDRVVYTGMPGVYAEYAVMPATWVILLPPQISTRLAAAILLQGSTAHYLSHDAYPLQPGDSALVLAAAGGVGRLLVQLAKQRSAFVIGYTSTQEKADIVQADGADAVIVGRGGGFAAQVRALTGGEGVNVVYDSIGQATFTDSLASLRRRGYLVAYGQASGPIPPFEPVQLAGFNRPEGNGSLYITWTSNSDYNATPEALQKRANDLFTAVLQGNLRVDIAAEFPLEAAADAHRLMESRTVTGKILLTVSV